MGCRRHDKSRQLTLSNKCDGWISRVSENMRGRAAAAVVSPFASATSRNLLEPISWRQSPSLSPRSSQSISIEPATKKKKATRADNLRRDKQSAAGGRDCLCKLPRPSRAVDYITSTIINAPPSHLLDYLRSAVNVVVVTEEEEEEEGKAAAAPVALGRIKKKRRPLINSTSLS